ncbi:inorganic phosphate transporter [Helicobacter sp. CLO-3]|uniref:inorganic phosphate transporter n=1 Tax=unclassified Helicobacter TaxID=2593540 RepID=UPI00080543D3|nr:MULTISPECIES: inorganic phosphate transporter [unclassified Helicobacter]OBV29019.1 phosphate permease [Helicobacter sp. CLO-3]OHU81719.1 inorganic phosphate transporter [Helicobacter sp. CLO-3]
MDIKDINKIQKGVNKKDNQIERIKIGVVMFFMVAIAIIAIQFGGSQQPILLAFATLFGGYMAMNIGANDVANNVGPAVGSQAITLTGAIIIAAICEAGGAILAGGDVVNTIKSDIIDPHKIDNPQIFLFIMLATLISGAIWVHLATILRAPVSTTHSIVGGVLGAGIAAGGLGVANWWVLGGIASSWVLSPVLGGVIAVLFLIFIKRTITYKQDKKEAAKKIVPILVFVMVWAFGVYLLLKGFSKLYSFSALQAILISLAVAVVCYLITTPMIRKKAAQLENTKESINTLFTLPLIFSAALLSFAHGANDVANAIGPLAAIHQALSESMDASVIDSGKASVPFWIMLIGGVGISLGLGLYGPRLIRTVGSEITELDRMRAFCIAMSAALTVLLASALGLPVSSTHIAIGAVIGVGFLREYIKGRYFEMCEQIVKAHKGKDQKTVESFLKSFARANVKQKSKMLEMLKNKTQADDFDLSKKEKKELKKFYKHELVKRSEINRIAASWIITVPASGLLGALAFLIIKGVLG